MLYKYIYFKFYDWGAHWFDPFTPQVTAAIIMSLLPVSNLFFILYFLDYFNLYDFKAKTINSDTFIIFIVLFIALLLFNQLYFFWVNKWKEIIKYFKENEAPAGIKTITISYVIISIGGSVFLYLFDSFIEIQKW